MSVGKQHAKRFNDLDCSFASDGMYRDIGYMRTYISEYATQDQLMVGLQTRLSLMNTAIELSISDDHN